MVMNGEVKIEKSFDETVSFNKVLEDGDFEEFFKDEGEYLDKLTAIAMHHGDVGDEFTVTYTVTVKGGEEHE